MVRSIRNLFRVQRPLDRPATWGDAVVLVTVFAVIYVGAKLAAGARSVIQGPQISLEPAALPAYAAMSLARMAGAYVLSLVFTLVYGHVAARNRRAEQVLIPLLDVLQSVPILSFLPVVLLSLSAVLPQRLALELAAVVLIFTSQVWNMTFSWYQSLRTIPEDLQEAAAAFGLSRWQRFKTLELPFAAIPLVWNSVMSWAGGWFFLMAAEAFTVGKRDFRLPGLGSYLRKAAEDSNSHAMLVGVVALVALIVLLDQLLWRPLLAWSNRFQLSAVAGEVKPTSWFYDALRGSRIMRLLSERVLRPVLLGVDELISRGLGGRAEPAERHEGLSPIGYVFSVGAGAALAYGAYRGAVMLFAVPAHQWASILLGVVATFGRVIAALAIAFSWTVPFGVLLASRPRLGALAQPLVQIAASIPATALFPIVLLFLLRLPWGLDAAAILLMLMGTQWYLLFNVLAGASAIPQDLRYTSLLLPLSRWQRWRVLILPALFPYLITGAITAGGGAWNASIVSEYVQFGGEGKSVVGIGALISHATAAGHYPLLFAATLSMILTVVMVNRLVWRRLYRVAERRYRME